MILFTSLEKSFEDLYNSLGKSAVSDFLRNGYELVDHYHLSLGVCIRNTILSEGSVVYSSFLRCGIKDKDTMSDLYLRLFYCYCFQRLSKS